MHVVVVRSVDEVVLQSDQIDRIVETDEVMDEEVMHVEVRLTRQYCKVIRLIRLRRLIR